MSIIIAVVIVLCCIPSLVEMFRSYIKSGQWETAILVIPAFLVVIGIAILSGMAVTAVLTGNVQ